MLGTCLFDIELFGQLPVLPGLAPVKRRQVLYAVLGQAFHSIS